MTDPSFTEFPQDEVVTYLSRWWPIPNNATLLLLDTDHTAFTGAVGVYPVPGRPGTTWWAVDGVIPPQPIGTPTQALAAMLPGSVLQTPPPPPAGDPSPPLT